MAIFNPEVTSAPDSEWRDYVRQGCERGVQGKIIESWRRCGRGGQPDSAWIGNFA